MFFVGELITFFCASVPRRTPAFLRVSHLMIVGRASGGWAPHRVLGLNEDDQAVRQGDDGPWVTVARASSDDAHEPDPAPRPEHLRA